MATPDNKPADKAPAGKPADVKAPETKAPATKASKVKVAAIKVSSAREGFRRGGHVFGREAVTLLVSDLTKDQLAQIKGERLLAVTDIEVDAAE
jgi:hypothetical protein